MEPLLKKVYICLLVTTIVIFSLLVYALSDILELTTYIYLGLFLILHISEALLLYFCYQRKHHKIDRFIEKCRNFALLEYALVIFPLIYFLPEGSSALQSSSIQIISIIYLAISYACFRYTRRRKTKDVSTSI